VLIRLPAAGMYSADFFDNPIFRRKSKIFVDEM
jgi:hypothetical protein